MKQWLVEHDLLLAAGTLALTVSIAAHELLGDIL